MKTDKIIAPVPARVGQAHPATPHYPGLTRTTWRHHPTHPEYGITTAPAPTPAPPAIDPEKD
jgi:hypothetical protein